MTRVEEPVAVRPETMARDVTTALDNIREYLMWRDSEVDADHLMVA